LGRASTESRALVERSLRRPPAAHATSLSVGHGSAAERPRLIGVTDPTASIGRSVAPVDSKRGMPGLYALVTIFTSSNRSAWHDLEGRLPFANRCCSAHTGSTAPWIVLLALPPIRPTHLRRATASAGLSEAFMVNQLTLPHVATINEHESFLF